MSDEQWGGKGFEEKSIQALVAADILRREEFGIDKYGTAIFARSTPIDPDEGGPLGQMYHELLDAVVYLRWYIEMHGTNAAFAFGALRAIETGEWDKHLQQLAYAISQRQKQIK